MPCSQLEAIFFKAVRFAVASLPCWKPVRHQKVNRRRIIVVIHLRNANRPKQFGSALLGCADHMLSIRGIILMAAGLMLSGSLQSFSAATAVLPHPVRQAPADELRIRSHHNRPSEARSVAQRQTRSDIATGAPYSGATTPTVGSPEWNRDAAETARREKELARKLNGICRGC